MLTSTLAVWRIAVVLFVQCKMLLWIDFFTFELRVKVVIIQIITVMPKMVEAMPKVLHSRVLAFPVSLGL